MTTGSVGVRVMQGINWTAATILVLLFAFIMAETALGAAAELAGTVTENVDRQPARFRLLA
jgi:hypothetical protein